MSNNIKFWLKFTSVMIVMVSLFVWLLVILGTGHEEDMVKQKQYYQECKERTGDPEWCMQSILDVEL